MSFPLIKLLNENVLGMQGWPKNNRWIVFARSSDFEDVLGNDISRNEALHVAQEAVSKMVRNHPGEEAIVNRHDDDWIVRLPSSDFDYKVSIETMKAGSVY